VRRLRLLLPMLVMFAACSRSKPEVPILNYHSVADVADEFTVPLPTFLSELDWLAAHDFHTVSLHELLESREHHGALPPRAIILTFDDGKEDALRLVLPALRKRGMKATFFVITGEVGRPGYLTWDGVRELAAAGMEIGSHTVTHSRLADVSADGADSELRESRQQLQSQLGSRVEALAYPFNSLRARTVRAAARAGYRIAVAGPAHGNWEQMRLLRLPIAGRADVPQFAETVSRYGQ
jgi:peptidoglycan/xylan/chitin deacetylase (PgdA/CDA1 family)